jgi:hypothetical protein
MAAPQQRAAETRPRQCPGTAQLHQPSERDGTVVGHIAQGHDFGEAFDATILLDMHKAVSIKITCRSAHLLPPWSFAAWGMMTV